MPEMLGSIKFKNQETNWILRISIYLLMLVALSLVLNILLLLVLGEGSDTSLLFMLFSFIIMSLSSFLIVLIFEKSKFRSRFGFENDNILKKYSLGYVIGALLIILSAFPIFLFFTSSFSLFSPIPYTAILSYFFFFIIQGASEEIMIRGLFFPVIVKYSNPIIALLLTSGIFSALHLMNPGINLISLINLFLGGLVFGYCVLYFDSLWQACGLHSAWNFIQGNILGFNVSGQKVESLATIKTEGSDLFTGGLFGVEGSVFSLVVLFIAIVTFHILCVKKGISLITYKDKVSTKS